MAADEPLSWSLDGPEGIDLLYRDHHLLFANKPAGLPTQGSSDHSLDGVEERCRLWLKNACGRSFLHVIHRLDKPVTGVVAMACSSKALERLQKSQRSREESLKKGYLLLMEGTPPHKEGLLHHYLTRDPKRCRSWAHETPVEGSQEAYLRYRLLDGDGYVSLVAVQLLTGRHHQIRAQWAAMGHPLLGDLRYGSSHLWQEEAIALHQAAYCLPHPVGGQPLSIRAPLPLGWPARWAPAELPHCFLE